MEALDKLFYLLAATLFISGLKKLSSPATAVRGNQLAATGMLVAIVTTLGFGGIVSWPMVVAGVVIGSGIGLFLARTIKMTSMPQMVALLNGLGGGASALVASAEYLRYVNRGEVPLIDVGISIQLSVLIGALTFSGSLIAFGKLQEIVTGRAITYPLQKILNALLLVGLAGMGSWVVSGNAPVWAFGVVVAISLLLGILTVIPIGGADMPVVISLLNSYSGIAAAMTGFVIGNHGLIISGALVGASGIILTKIMCKAMNRSLASVLFGAFGATGTKSVGGGTGGGEDGDLTVTEVSIEDAAMMLAYAKSVIVVPGYGLAVAQAQHDVREMAELIERNGGDVKYAIHPVAGRMPGHMNVLLAEANIPYPQLKDMDEINPAFARADVALVIGANDVVNPGARDDKENPLYGMPILDVDKAHHVIVMKRSMSPGFAGVANPLFYAQNTSMLFGSAKDSVVKLVEEMKQL